MKTMGVTAVVRIPVITNRDHHDALYKILTEPLYDCKIVLSSKIHHPFFFLKIVPIKFPYPESHPRYKQRFLKLLMDYGLKVRFVEEYIVYGIYQRHLYWKRRYDKLEGTWKPERYKHLVKMGLTFQVTLASFEVLRNIVVKPKFKSKDKKRKVREARNDLVQMGNQMDQARSLFERVDN